MFETDTGLEVALSAERCPVDEPNTEDEALWTSAVAVAALVVAGWGPFATATKNPRVATALATEVAILPSRRRRVRFATVLSS